MKKPKFYKVEWLDVRSNSAWHTWKEAHKFLKESGKKYCVSHGYLIAENENDILLASSHDGEPIEERCWGELIWIPKLLIVKKKLVEVDEA